MYMKEDSTSGNTEGPIGGVSLKHYILQSSTSQLEDLLNFKIQDFDYVLVVAVNSTFSKCQNVSNSIRQHS